MTDQVRKPSKTQIMAAQGVIEADRILGRPTKQRYLDIAAGRWPSEDEAVSEDHPKAG